MSGETATSPSPANSYWERQFNDKFDDISLEASLQIVVVTRLMGTHNYDLEMLDLYCGFGAMVQKMVGGGFEKAKGMDPDPSVEEYWDREGCLEVDNPLSCDYEDESFDLVTCFGGFSRISQPEYPTLLEEMKRLTKGKIIFKPYADRGNDTRKEVIPLLLEHRLVPSKYNPFRGHYILTKES